MNKAVMLAVQPQWCERISSGKKKIDVRKTAPKLDTPFKCYIYCTNKKHKGEVLLIDNGGNAILGDYRNADYGWQIRNGKVVGEFICNKIDKYCGRLTTYAETPYKNKYVSPEDLAKTCLSIGEINDDYLKGSNAYFWHISGLKIYDEPKEIWEFNRFLPCELSKQNCGMDGWKELDEDCALCALESVITFPPQSWFYVKEFEA